jgi:hypothetical protein
MLSSNIPWQANTGANHLPNVLSNENQLTTAKQKPAAEQAKIYKAKVVTTKRYSFDDNGGGYEGL